MVWTIRLHSIQGEKMDNQWKNESCGTCDFAMEWKTGQSTSDCQRNPPVQRSSIFIHFLYPVVEKHTPACSCWREKNAN